MKEPREDLKAEGAAEDDLPDFEALTPPEELVRGERTRDDFFDAVLQLDEPTTVDDVATLADHGSDAAREYLDWFERMGIVTQVSESPVTYQLNREYLTWRRVQRIRDGYDTDELVDLLEAETERDRAYADDFGVESPDAVSLSEYAADTDRSIQDVWEALSDWKTTRRRIAILERALTETGGDSFESQRPVA